MRAARAILLVIDGGGAGASEDAARYGDSGSVNSLGNVAKAAGGLRLSNLEQMGLGCVEMKGVQCVTQPRASWARLREASNGKDSMTGHWEMMGITIHNAFPTYPNGFPREVIEQFEALIGRKVLGNVVASGNQIIEGLGLQHLRTGYPIIYTSADSVFQVAAHEEVVQLQTLWDWCAKARAMLVPPHRVNRVIARPLDGPVAFHRTACRRDYTVRPPSPSMLECLQDAGIAIVGLGKIQDIYSCQGISAGSRTADNDEGLRKTAEWLQRGDRGFCFTNLNDFDSKYGHRRDADAYAKALMALDEGLAELLKALTVGDRLIITADHGCDPTAPGPDHTREFAPLLDYRPGVAGQALGVLDSFSQVGRRILETFGLPAPAELVL